MKVVYLLVLLLSSFFINSAYSSPVDNESVADAKAYCHYITKKNKLKSILLRSPEAIARLDNGLTYNNFQKIAITGLSKDLSDLGKAHYISTMIKQECVYYTLNQMAKLQIQYAIASIKNQSLKSKLDGILRAKKQLNTLVKNSKNRLNQHHDTLINYYDLDSSLIKLMDMEREIYIELASQRVPQIPRKNLIKLQRELAIAQEKRQKSLSKLASQDNWSMRVEVGTQQDLSSYQNKSVQPYFALLLRYNLGALYTSTQENKSITDYMQWQKNEVLGTQKELIELIRSITVLKKAEKERLTILQRHLHKHRDLNQQINANTSLKATHFKQTIEINNLMLAIEINALKRSIQLLDELTS